MDGVKKEDELTSTMGNVMSTSNKEEKSDSSDATPTSSTDANTNPTSSRAFSDDPISSTSSDIFDQKTPAMNRQTLDETDKAQPTDQVNELLGILDTNEKVTEDVEDLVHDLESLLGEASEPFTLPTKSTEKIDVKPPSNANIELEMSKSAENNLEEIVTPNEEETVEDASKDKKPEEICQKVLPEAPEPTEDLPKVDEDTQENLVVLEHDYEGNGSSAEPDNSETAKNEEIIKELPDEDSTSSWELIEHPETVEKESLVTSTPDDSSNKTLQSENTQNMGEDITSSADKASTSMERQDSEESREADSAHTQIIDETTSPSEEIQDLVDEDETAGKTEEHSSEAEAVPLTGEANPTEEHAEVKESQSAIEISSSEVCSRSNEETLNLEVVESTNSSSLHRKVEGTENDEIADKETQEEVKEEQESSLQHSGSVQTKVVEEITDDAEPHSENAKENIQMDPKQQDDTQCTYEQPSLDENKAQNEDIAETTPVQMVESIPEGSSIVQNEDKEPVQALEAATSPIEDTREERQVGIDSGEAVSHSALIKNEPAAKEQSEAAGASIEEEKRSGINSSEADSELSPGNNETETDKQSEAISESMKEEKRAEIGSGEADSFSAPGNCETVTEKQSEATGANIEEESRVVIDSSEADSFSAVGNSDTVTKEQSEEAGVSIEEEKRSGINSSEADSDFTLGNIETALENQSEATGASVEEEKLVEIGSGEADSFSAPGNSEKATEKQSEATGANVEEEKRIVSNPDEADLDSILGNNEKVIKEQAEEEKPIEINSSEADSHPVLENSKTATNNQSEAAGDGGIVNRRNDIDPVEADPDSALGNDETATKDKSEGKIRIDSDLGQADSDSALAKSETATADQSEVAESRTGIESGETALAKNETATNIVSEVFIETNKAESLGKQSPVENVVEKMEIEEDITTTAAIESPNQLQTSEDVVGIETETTESKCQVVASEEEPTQPDSLQDEDGRQCEAVAGATEASVDETEAELVEDNLMVSKPDSSSGNSEKQLDEAKVTQTNEGTSETGTDTPREDQSEGSVGGNSESTKDSVEAGAGESDSKEIESIPEVSICNIEPVTVPVALPDSLAESSKLEENTMEITGEEAEIATSTTGDVKERPDSTEPHHELPTTEAGASKNPEEASSSVGVEKIIMEESQSKLDVVEATSSAETNDESTFKAKAEESQVELADTSREKQSEAAANVVEASSSVAAEKIVAELEEEDESRVKVEVAEDALEGMQSEAVVEAGSSAGVEKLVTELEESSVNGKDVKLVEDVAKVDEEESKIVIEAAKDLGKIHSTDVDVQESIAKQSTESQSDLDSKIMEVNTSEIKENVLPSKPSETKDSGVVLTTPTIIGKEISKKIQDLEFAPLQLSEDDDSDEETVPRLVLTPEEMTITLPEENIITLPEEMEEKPVFVQNVIQPTVETPENLETILAVASLQNIDIPKHDGNDYSEKERKEMEALALAVQSITDTSSNSYIEDFIEPVIEQTILQREDVEEKVTEIESVTKSAPIEEDDNQTAATTKEIVNEVPVAVTNEVTTDVINKVDEQETSEREPEQVAEASTKKVEELLQEPVVETSSIEEKTLQVPVVEESVPEATQQVQKTPNSSAVENIILEESNQHQHDLKLDRETKTRLMDKGRKHRKSEKYEELTINVDVPDREKTYSPKITIKPIKVPDEEVSTTTSMADSEVKGSLKMTITKQSDNMHSILKISDQENSDVVLEADEPIPKLIIKPKMQQVEQQHSPKMSTRSSKHSPTSSTQRSGSPRITIKPVVKQQEQPVTPLKIKINTKVNSKAATTKDEDPARKLVIKPVVKPVEEPPEQMQSPRITIKPIPKPDGEKEPSSPRVTIKPIPKPEGEKEPPNPRLTIKPLKKPEEDLENEDKERSNPKIIIKPIVKPQDCDVVVAALQQDEEEIKERIVLKINKGNLPHSPVRESKKREHSEEDKSEKLAKITVKFSKEGGHPHIVQQPGEEATAKRQHDEINASAAAAAGGGDKNKKQKVDVDVVVVSRSEAKSSPGTKHKNIANESPVDVKRMKKDVNEKCKSKETDACDDVHIIESKIDSPITISEDSRSQDSGSVILLDDLKEDSMSSVDTIRTPEVSKYVVKANLSGGESATPSPVPRKRGRPRKTISPPKESETREIGATIDNETISDMEAVTPSSIPATPSPLPRKKGRPRKVIVEVQDDPKSFDESKLSNSKVQQHESGRPKRSCRGQSVCDTLGIKPRKSRGSGRGRGSLRGIGNRSLTDRDVAPPFGQSIETSSFGKKDVIIVVDDTPLIKHQSKLKPDNDIVIEIDSEDSKDSKTQSEETIDAVKVPSFVELKEKLSKSIGKVGEGSRGGKTDEGTVPFSILAPPATRKDFSELGTSMPIAQLKPSNSELIAPSSSKTLPSEIMIVDEDTRMSADTNSRAQTPAKQVVTNANDLVEESQSSIHSSNGTENSKTPSRPNKAPRLEVQDSDSAIVTADLLSEYYWNGNGPFMLQEQVAQFLGIKSFKRKYPGIMRRMLDMQERDYIREQGLASEHMCDLGLTAVNAADILDIMYSDFQEKYEEYCKHQRDRQAKEMISKQRALTLAATQEKCKADLTEQAVQSAAQWNLRFNKARKEQRKTCMDLQNLTVHYPKGKMTPNNPVPHPGNYPVALVPGQFGEYFEEFTPTELNNLPINTICYDPVNFIPREDTDESASEGSDSDSDSESGSSSSSSDSDSSSGVDDCKLCKHSPKKLTPATSPSIVTAK